LCLAGDVDAELIRGAAQADDREEAMLARTIAVLFAGAESGDDEEFGGAWTPLLRAKTAPPARRTLSVTLPTEKAGLEVREAIERINFTLEKMATGQEDKETEVRERVAQKTAGLGGLALNVGGRPLRVQLVATREGKFEVSV
jgi:hypothetical protein